MTITTSQTVLRIYIIRMTTVRNAAIKLYACIRTQIDTMKLCVCSRTQIGVTKLYICTSAQLEMTKLCICIRTCTYFWKLCVYYTYTWNLNNVIGLVALSYKEMYGKLKQMNRYDFNHKHRVAEIVSQRDARLGKCRALVGDIERETIARYMQSTSILVRQRTSDQQWSFPTHTAGHWILKITTKVHKFRASSHPLAMT